LAFSKTLLRRSRLARAFVALGIYLVNPAWAGPSSHRLLFHFSFFDLTCRIIPLQVLRADPRKFEVRFQRTGSGQEKNDSSFLSGTVGFL
jgi:hypothetical protein